MSTATLPPALSEHHSPMRQDVSHTAKTSVRKNHPFRHANEDSDAGSSVSSTAAVTELKFESQKRQTSKAKRNPSPEAAAASESPFDVPGTSPILPSPTAEQIQSKKKENQHAAGLYGEDPVWQYPRDIRLPTNETLKSLFENASQAGESSDQTELCLLGIYSFKDVFLPAICHQHNTALKKVQAIMQRDQPERVHEVVALRTFLYETTKLSQEAVRAAAQHRQNVIHPQLEKEIVYAKEREELEVEQRRALERVKRQKELKRQYVPNKEMWKEVACLVPLLQKLEKEEKVWQEAKREVEEYEKAALPNYQKLINDVDDAMDVDDDSVRSHDENLPPERQNNFSSKVMQQVEGMELSCTRVAQGLDVVEKAIESSEVLCRRVVSSYQQIQFSGNMGFGANAKELVHIMSQEDPM